MATRATSPPNFKSYLPFPSFSLQKAKSKSVLASIFFDRSLKLHSIFSRRNFYENMPMDAKTKKARREFLKAATFSINGIASFSLVTVLMWSRMNSSSMANAFVTAPAATKTRFVQMAPSLIRHESIALDDDSKVLSGNIEFHKYDGILDMSSSVATTAATKANRRIGRKQALDKSNIQMQRN